jgi:hypothetical protein
MQTTLRIDDKLYREAKAAAARQGVTITSYIEEALRLRLRSGGSSRRGPDAVTLPTFSGGGFPYSPEKLKALALQSEAVADRKKLSQKRQRRG